jgi:hypothetical protein
MFAHLQFNGDWWGTKSEWGRQVMHTTFCLESLMGGDRLRDRRVIGSIILKTV